MITHLMARNFRAVPWLETSSLMSLHPDGIQFSLEKPNVVVGLNGAGKSALLTALSLRTLTYYTDDSRFDSKYVSGLHGRDRFFSKQDRWGAKYEYLEGLTTEGDLAPSLYYRPNRIPGNRGSIAESMMTGYSEEARVYARMTERKSSGQKSQAVQDRLLRVLAGEPLTYTPGIKREKIEIDNRYYSGESDAVTNAFVLAYEKASNRGVPLVIMDEPEQSLDLLAELKLWHAIQVAKTQVIVATHSMYPFLNAEKFNIIEASPNYCAVVQNALKGAIPL